MNVHISSPDVFHGNRLYSGGLVDSGQSLRGTNNHGIDISAAKFSLQLIGGSGRLTGRAKTPRMFDHAWQPGHTK